MLKLLIFSTVWWSWLSSTNFCEIHPVFNPHLSYHVISLYSIYLFSFILHQTCMKKEIQRRGGPVDCFLNHVNYKLKMNKYSNIYNFLVHFNCRLKLQFFCLTFCMQAMFANLDKLLAPNRPCHNSLWWVENSFWFFSCIQKNALTIACQYYSCQTQVYLCHLNIQGTVYQYYLVVQDHI